MVQIPITPPRIKESLLLRRSIFWMRLLIAGKRSDGEGNCGEGKIIKSRAEPAFLAVSKRQKAAGKTKSISGISNITRQILIIIKKALMVAKDAVVIEMLRPQRAEI